MSKSVRERAMDVAHVAAYGHSGSPEIEGPVVRAVRGLADAGLLATPALLECGEACKKAGSVPAGAWLGDDHPTAAWYGCVDAGRALQAEREGRVDVDAAKARLEREEAAFASALRAGSAPSTAEVDRALVDHMLNMKHPELVQWEPGIYSRLAACRKAREPRPRYGLYESAGYWGVWDNLKRCSVTSGARPRVEAEAIAAALEALEAK